MEYDEWEKSVNENVPDQDNFYKRDIYRIESDKRDDDKSQQEKSPLVEWDMMTTFTTTCGFYDTTIKYENKFSDPTWNEKFPLDDMITVHIIRFTEVFSSAVKDTLLKIDPTIDFNNHTIQFYLGFDYDQTRLKVVLNEIVGYKQYDIILDVLYSLLIKAGLIRNQKKLKERAAFLFTQTVFYSLVSITSLLYFRHSKTFSQCTDSSNITIFQNLMVAACRAYIRQYDKIIKFDNVNLIDEYNRLKLSLRNAQGQNFVLAPFNFFENTPENESIIHPQYINLVKEMVPYIERKSIIRNFLPILIIGKIDKCAEIIFSDDPPPYHSKNIISLIPKGIFKPEQIASLNIFNEFGFTVIPQVNTSNICLASSLLREIREYFDQNTPFIKTINYQDLGFLKRFLTRSSLFLNEKTLTYMDMLDEQYKNPTMKVLNSNQEKKKEKKDQPSFPHFSYEYYPSSIARVGRIVNSPKIFNTQDSDRKAISSPLLSMNTRLLLEGNAQTTLEDKISKRSNDTVLTDMETNTLHKRTSQSIFQFTSMNYDFFISIVRKLYGYSFDDTRYLTNRMVFGDEQPMLDKAIYFFYLFDSASFFVTMSFDLTNEYRITLFESTIKIFKQYTKGKEKKLVFFVNYSTVFTNKFINDLCAEWIILPNRFSTKKIKANGGSGHNVIGSLLHGYDSTMMESINFTTESFLLFIMKYKDMVSGGNKTYDKYISAKNKAGNGDWIVFEYTQTAIQKNFEKNNIDAKEMDSLKKSLFEQNQIGNDVIVKWTKWLLTLFIFSPGTYISPLDGYQNHFSINIGRNYINSSPNSKETYESLDVKLYVPFDTHFSSYYDYNQGGKFFFDWFSWMNILREISNFIHENRILKNKTLDDYEKNGLVKFSGSKNDTIYDCFRSFLSICKNMSESVSLTSLTGMNDHLKLGLVGVEVSDPYKIRKKMIKILSMQYTDTASTQRVLAENQQGDKNKAAYYPLGDTLVEIEDFNRYESMNKLLGEFFFGKGSREMFPIYTYFIYSWVELYQFLFKKEQTLKDVFSQYDQVVQNLDKVYLFLNTIIRGTYDKHFLISHKYTQTVLIPLKKMIENVVKYIKYLAGGNVNNTQYMNAPIFAEERFGHNPQRIEEINVNNPTKKDIVNLMNLLNHFSRRQCLINQEKNIQWTQPMRDEAQLIKQNIIAFELTYMQFMNGPISFKLVNMACFDIIKHLLSSTMLIIKEFFDDQYYYTNTPIQRLDPRYFYNDLKDATLGCFKVTRVRQDFTDDYSDHLPMYDKEVSKNAYIKMDDGKNSFTKTKNKETMTKNKSPSPNINTVNWASFGHNEPEEDDTGFVVEDSSTKKRKEFDNETSNFLNNEQTNKPKVSVDYNNVTVTNKVLHKTIPLVDTMKTMTNSYLYLDSLLLKTRLCTPTEKRVYLTPNGVDGLPTFPNRSSQPENDDSVKAWDTIGENSIAGLLLYLENFLNFYVNKKKELNRAVVWDDVKEFRETKILGEKCLKTIDFLFDVFGNNYETLPPNLLFFWRLKKEEDTFFNINVAVFFHMVFDTINLLSYYLSKLPLSTNTVGQKIDQRKESVIRPVEFGNFEYQMIQSPLPFLIFQNTNIAYNPFQDPFYSAYFTGRNLLLTINTWFYSNNKENKLPDKTYHNVVTSIQKNNGLHYIPHLTTIYTKKDLSKILK